MNDWRNWVIYVVFGLLVGAGIEIVRSHNAPDTPCCECQCDCGDELPKLHEDVEIVKRDVRELLRRRIGDVGAVEAKP